MKYFKHQSNMRHDRKIKRVINRYGLEGYGLYNLIVESIVEGLATENPLPALRETAAEIAEFYRSNTTRIEEIVEFMVSLDLIEVNLTSNLLTCAKIYKYLDGSSTRSESLKKMIAAYKADVSPILSQTNQDIQVQKGQNKNQNQKRQKAKKSGLDSASSSCLKVENTALPYQVLAYLNQSVGLNFDSYAESGLQSLIDSGYALSDFILVIDYKCREWLGTKYAANLRPRTLFSPNRFNEYLNQAKLVSTPSMPLSGLDRSIDPLDSLWGTK